MSALMVRFLVEDYYSYDKRRVDSLELNIRQLIGGYFVAPATRTQDMHEATDLMVFELRAQHIRVGCRVRRYDYWAAQNGRYQREFTIRSGRPNGIKTEYQKIIDGWGDYLFYGFADPSDQRVYHATLIDLEQFRASVIGFYVQPTYYGNNYDGSSSFHIYTLDDFPSTLICCEWQWDEQSHRYDVVTARSARFEYDR